MTVVRGPCEVRRDCRTDPDEAHGVVVGLALCCGARGPCTAAQMAQQKSEKFIRTASAPAVTLTLTPHGLFYFSKPLRVACRALDRAPSETAPAQWTVQLNPGLANAVTLVTTLRSEHLHTPQHFDRKAARPTRDPKKKMKRAWTVGLIASDCV